MSLASYQEFMLPVLEALADGRETPVSEIRERVAVAVQITPEERQRRLSSGQLVLVNRVAWAILGLRQANLVAQVGRGAYCLTEEGRRLLERQPGRIDQDMLRSYPAYAKWEADYKAKYKEKKARRELPSSGGAGELSLDVTPEEALDNIAQRLQDELETEVLERVRSAGSSFFEQLVVNLLVKMGYGGADRGRVTGGAGDGGIDGVIKEDVLGLDEVYIQAKCYGEGNTVGESALRNFAGAIDTANTTKGVFVTTSDFTRSAVAYAEKSPKQIVLINGARLAQLMVRYGIGVRSRATYKLKRIDEDYFDQEAG